MVVGFPVHEQHNFVDEEILEEPSDTPSDEFAMMEEVLEKEWCRNIFIYICGLSLRMCRTSTSALIVFKQFANFPGTPGIF
jgi:hypothetical protein